MNPPKTPKNQSQKRIKVQGSPKVFSDTQDCDCRMMIGGSGKLCPKCQTPEAKVCKNCDELRPLIAFRNRDDGKNTNYCLDCERWERKQYARVYKKDPLKAQARNKLWNYIKANKIVINNCSKCGSAVNIDLHHPDYNKPLEFIPLCHKCHMRLHNEEK